MISNPKVKQWTAKLFMLLTLFCLLQNGGMASLLIKSMSLSSAPVVSLSLVATQSLSAQKSVGESAEFSGSSEFKMCELSEKSMRSCVESPSVLLLLVILSSFAIFPFIRPRLLGRLSYNNHAKPRRIHISLCRFQE